MSLRENWWCFSFRDTGEICLNYEWVVNLRKRIQIGFRREEEPGFWVDSDNSDGYGYDLENRSGTYLWLCYAIPIIERFIMNIRNKY